ncbi:FMN-binding protein [Arthrobacter sp. H-02-3]|uniref:FMN-binding protein n=1 Tax=Arthrobacter sp. H-02-3 TaxID=2703675 RepID=UPI000DD227C9|nr:FMN-binding protein [Arthrobacter sp. H-02-3]PVZ56963.1 FMN-binding protein [Arthrobacter sp. H-02-3]
MRIRAAVSATLASAGILLVGWQSGSHVTEAAGSSIGTSAGTTGTTGSTGASAATGSGSGSSSGTSTSGAASGSGATGSTGSTETTTSAAGAGNGSGTFAGSVSQTRFGNVQVQITVSGGKITDVTALQLTDEDRRSVAISNRAAPLLRSEVLQAQSANVQTIGGATVTSDAYLSSLQAALDAANL